MNRIYKTIWNAATQSWTVAGELASAKGKSASKTVSTLATLSVVSILGVSSAMAADNAVPKLTSVEQTPATNIVTKDGKTIIIINNDSKNSVTTETNSKDGNPKHIIVVGSQNKQVYDGQILIGYEINSPAQVYSENGKSAGKAGDVAIGHHITLGGSDGTTAGDTAKNVQDSFSTAVGYGSQAVGPVVAMGVGARSDMRAYQGWDSVKEGIVAVGPFALAADNKNGTTAIGALSAANYDNSVAIGALSGAAADWEDRGIGEQFNPGIDQAGKDKAKYQILESYGPSNVRQGLTSVGYKAGARGGASTALGFEAVTGVANTKFGENSTAVGVRAHAVKDNSLAIGDNALAGGLTKAEVEQMKKENDGEIARLQALWGRAKDVLDKAQDRLKDDGSAENKFKVASATATLERINLAIERAKKDATRLSNKDSNTQFSIAIGSSAHANNYQTTAIGRLARAYGAGSNAVGYEARAEGDRSNAIGYKTIVGKTFGNTRTDSTAIGTNNIVDTKEVMVLGNNVEIDNNGKTRNGAVVLGHNSTGKEHTVKAVNSATVGKTTYSGFKGNLGGEDKDGKPADAAGDKQGRFVSIGKKGEERQIKHVAAGWIDADSTDAINGSQLYGMTSALDTRVTKNEDDIKNLDGRVTKNEGDIANINTKLGDINTNVTALGNRAWTISDGKNENPIKDDKVTFKGENGVTVSLGKDNTVTIKGGLTDADKQNIANDISNNIENVLNNKDVGFAIKQNGKNTLDANGNPLTKTEKVTPKDTVNFKNGNGTTVKAVTKKGATPTASDETSISVDVDGIKFTDKNGNNVVRDDNGNYVKADANGNPTGEKVDNKDVIMNINNPAGGNTVINNLQVNGGKVEAGSKDAVNGDQLHKVAQQVNKNTQAIDHINNRLGDIDGKMGKLNNKIDGVDKRASRGIATAGAMGMLPQPHISGRSMVSAATTSYRGQQSLAVGYSRLSDNGKHIIKFSGASNLSGKKDAMVGAAYGYQW
ncbi:hypothetical protein A9501_03940 [Haemophilus sp. CCUG 66565]|uniref:ESPR-type extended signal peptide-containing protein n=1 Tax=Haemophilus sp. CCUG 66565 TaxID=1859694 RepID=UPI0008031594|nr:ESPR-type extended signal peptide-containing protein [Haemophilus sp. CCUG 66565]OBX85995.1 hypothetical protein A9501_03940 [Haemophilus sp. CCUG 66565]